MAEVKTETTFFVHRAGPSTAPAVLFLHGSPLSGRMWLPQLERLTEFHCLAPDLPEHGRSADLTPFRMEDTVTRLAQLICDSSPNGQAHIVGLSFGGVVAQRLMVQTPEVVDHVILSGTAARFGKTLTALLKFQLKLNEPLTNLLNPGQLSILISIQFGIPPQYRAMLGEDIKQVSSSALSRFVLATYADIVTPPISHNPVLVIVGQRETPVAKVMAHRLRNGIAGSTGIVIPNGGHLWNLQFPDLCAQVVRAWVTDQTLPSQVMPL